MSFMSLYASISDDADSLYDELSSIISDKEVVRQAVIYYQRENPKI